MSAPLWINNKQAGLIIVVMQWNWGKSRFHLAIFLMKY